MCEYVLLMDVDGRCTVVVRPYLEEYVLDEYVLDEYVLYFKR